VIHFILASVPPNIKPYKYLYAKKREIKCMVAKMLEVGIVQPSRIYFFALVTSIGAQEVRFMAYVSKL